MNLGGALNASTYVSQLDSLTDSGVYSAVNQICSTLSSLPIRVIKDGKGEKEVDNNHPIHKLLSIEPNSHQTPFQFIESWVSNALLFGRAGAYILRDSAGVPVSLEVYEGRVEKVFVDKQCMYRAANGDTFHPSEMLVIENFKGYSPIKLHNKNLSINIATRNMTADYYENGGSTEGVLSSKGLDLSNTNTDHLSSQFANQKGKVKIIDGDEWDFNATGLDPEQNQLKVTREFQLSEVSRIFQIPEMMLGGKSNVTYSNVEAINIMYTQQTILPWVTKIEQEIQHKLLTSTQKITHSVEVVLDNLLRGDKKARTEHIRTLVGSGVMTINEARAEEGFTPTEDGDKHLVQVNQIPLSQMDDYAKSITDRPKKDVKTKKND